MGCLTCHKCPKVELEHFQSWRVTCFFSTRFDMFEAHFVTVFSVLVAMHSETRRCEPSLNGTTRAMCITMCFLCRLCDQACTSALISSGSCRSVATSRIISLQLFRCAILHPLPDSVVPLLCIFFFLIFKLAAGSL